MKEFRTYRKLVKDQASEWLFDCYKNPTKYMNKFHIAIIKSVLIRRKFNLNS